MARAWVEDYALKSGARFRVRWYDDAGHERSKSGFARKIDARAFASEVESNMNSGGVVVAPSAAKATVTAVGERWLARRVGLKPSWASRQESIWRIHVEPYWGSRRLTAVTTPAVRDWVTELVEGGSAPSSIEDIVGVLQAVLDTAIEERRMRGVNPARGVDLPRRGAADHIYLTHERLAEFIGEVSRPEIVALLGYSGIRWGEMSALRPRDFDFDANRIRIARSASKVNQRSVIGEPKNWERRTVAVPGSVMDMLRPVVERQRDLAALVWSRPSDGAPIMPPTSTHWFTKGWQRLRGPDPSPTLNTAERINYERERFPRLKAHDLRHTAASLMIRSGANIKTVQRQLGHKTATMTLDTYGHLYPDDLDVIEAVMNRGFRAARETQCGRNAGDPLPGASIEA